MPNGTIKCYICTRQYKSRAALMQHKLASHSGVSPGKGGNVGAKNKKTAPKKNNRTGARGNGAPVAIPMNVVANQSDRAHLTGTDRYETISDVSKFEGQSVIIQKLFSPADLPRLRQVAKAFQRVKYNYLRFRVEPQISTATSGGYVAAFVMDADDNLPGTTGVNVMQYLTSTKNSVTTKWWQSATVAPGPFSRLYYTSEGIEARETCPGQFILASDGKATQSGNLTVYVEWSVVLSEPSLESEHDLDPIAEVLEDLYTNNKETSYYGGLQAKVAGKFVVKNVDKLIAGAQTGRVYKLKTPVYVQETATVIRACWYVACTAKDHIKLMREDASDAFTAPIVTEILAIVKGTVLEDISPKPSNFQMPASPLSGAKAIEDGSEPSSSKSSRNCKESSNDLTTLIKGLTSLLTKFDSLAQDLSQKRDSSLSLVQPPSTGSPQHSLVNSNISFEVIRSRSLDDLRE